MARSFPETANFDAAVAPITGMPFTMACWALNDKSTFNDRCMMQIQDKSAPKDYYRMGIGNAGSSITSLPVNGHISTEGYFHTTAVTTLNKWFHACTVFASTTSRSVYLDGGNKATDTTAEVAPVNIDSISIGIEGDSTPSDEWSGGIMWPAVWDIALNDEEVAALAAGAPPWTVRPEALVFFAPLTHGTGDERDLISGTALIEAGVVGEMEGPPVLMPDDAIWLPPLASPSVVARTYHAFPTAATTNNIPLGTPTEGNLGIIAISARNDATNGSDYDTPTGWTEYRNECDQGTNRGLRGIWMKVMEASETTPVAVTISPTDNMEQMAVFMEVSDWGGSLDDVEITTSDFGSVAAVTSITPSSITPSWGAEESLFIIGVLALDDNSSVSTWPTGYTAKGTSQNASGGNNNNAMVGTSYRSANTTTETPGLVTLSETEGVATFTIAVRPASASLGVGFPYYLFKQRRKAMQTILTM